MKLFITVFSAIIAAAVVIVSALWAVARVSDWERTKLYYKSRILAEYDMTSLGYRGEHMLGKPALPATK
jgi:hypothetical protein